MDMYKFKFTRLQNEIFRLLCIKSGEKLNQREIARLLKVSPTAVAKAIPLLNKEKLVKYEKYKGLNLNYLEFNRDNDRALQFKRVENLKMLYESGIVEVLEDSFQGCTIILFGSYSRGEDILIEGNEGYKSDIDIAIVGIKSKEIELKEFEDVLERKIILNFYPSFKEIHKNLKNNILNGILLSGSVEI